MSDHMSEMSAKENQRYVNACKELFYFDSIEYLKLASDCYGLLKSIDQNRANQDAKMDEYLKNNAKQVIAKMENFSSEHPPTLEVEWLLKNYPEVAQVYKATDRSNQMFLRQVRKALVGKLSDKQIAKIEVQLFSKYLALQ